MELCKEEYHLKLITLKAFVVGGVFLLLSLLSLSFELVHETREIEASSCEKSDDTQIETKRNQKVKEKVKVEAKV